NAEGEEHHPQLGGPTAGRRLVRRLATDRGRGHRHAVHPAAVAAVVGVALPDGVLAGLDGVTVGVGAGAVAPGAGSAEAGMSNAVDGAHWSAAGTWVCIGPGLFTTGGGLDLVLAAWAF